MRIPLGIICTLLLVSVALARTVVVTGTDSAGIKAAIEASRAGDEVRLPAGRYTISEAIQPKSGTRLVGAGQDETVITFGGEKGCGLITLNGVEGVVVTDLTLDAGNSPLVPVGIGAYDSRRLTIRRVTIRNLAKTPGGAQGIHFSGNAPTREKGVTDSLIEGCMIQNIAPEYEWGGGIRCSWGSSRNCILNCRIDNTGRGGIFGDNGSNDLIIRGNTVTRSHGERLGIEVWGGCDRCVIEDNRIDHWLSIGGSDWCATRRNTVSCHEQDCFGFIGIEAIGSYLVFTDNVVDDGQVIGLSVSNIDRKEYHYYADNVFRHCSQWAAQLQGETTGCRDYYFLRCKFSDTTVGRGKVIYPGDDGNGFRINGNCRGFTLEDCDMSDNARNGMQVTTPGGGDVLSFNRCRIERNEGAAIVHVGGFTGLEWNDCTVSGNASNELPAAAPMPAAPTAGFTGPTEVRVGQTMQFRSTATAGGAEIEKVLWDFGDGAPETGNAVRYVYEQPGTYRVTQIVWDSNGRAARATATVEVRP